MSLILLLFGIACSRSEPKADCWNARQRARDAMAQGKLAEAGQLLEQARAVCGERSADDIRRIETAIADRRATERRLEQAEAKQRLAQGSPTKRFVRWAIASASSAGFESTLANVKCAAQGDPDFGFCDAEREGSPNMSVRYWKRDPKAARYSFTTDAAIECEDLGEHRRIRAWSTDGQLRELCELTERESRDISALLIRADKENRMYIYSFEYLQKDPDFERELRTKK